jgi:hypothetical protein
MLGAGWTEVVAVAAAFAIAVAATPAGISGAVIAIGARYLWSGLDVNER